MGLIVPVPSRARSAARPPTHPGSSVRMRSSPFYLHPQAAPKNTKSLDYILCAASLAGSLLSLYAFVKGPGDGRFPAEWYVLFVSVTFTLYAIGFFLTPKAIIDMNFTVRVDKYHEFLGRFCGFTMLLFAIAIYQAQAFKVAAIWSFGCGLIGPTYAGLYLEPKQTAMGHMPAHILFLIGGVLGAGAV